MASCVAADTSGALPALCSCFVFTAPQPSSAYPFPCITQRCCGSFACYAPLSLPDPAPKRGRNNLSPSLQVSHWLSMLLQGRYLDFFYSSYNDQIINYENRWLWLRSSFSNNVVKQLGFYLPPRLSRPLQPNVHFEEMQPAAMWSSYLNQRRAVTAGMPMTQG